MVVGDLLSEFKETASEGNRHTVLTLTEHKGFIPQSQRFNKRLALENTAGYKVIRRNDFAFNPYLLWAGALARNTIVDSGVISPLYPTFRVKEGFDPSFVNRLLLSDHFVRTYDSIAFGSIPRRRRSSVADFLALPVTFIPCLEEQRRIAAILDQADDVRAKRRAQLAHLDELPQALFHEMFGDPGEALKEVPFGSVASLSGGRNIVAKSDSINPKYRVLKISAVTSGAFRPDESKPLPGDYDPPTSHIVHQGDLLMSRANTTELVGAVTYVSVPTDALVLPDKIWRFDWREADSSPLFYATLLRTPTMRSRISGLSNGSGASMKNIAKSKLEQMPLPYVSASEQQTFAEKVEAIQTERSRVARALEADDELFAALQYRAFRGEL